MQEIATPIYQYGAAVGSAIICTGLFVWSQVQAFVVRTDLKEHMNNNDKSFADLKQLVVSSIETHRVVASGLERIAEAIQHQSASHESQLSFLREMSADQKAMLANQAAAQAGTQRLLEQLVGKITG